MMCDRLGLLREEVNAAPPNAVSLQSLYLAKGYGCGFDAPHAIARARAIAALFEVHEKHIYQNDLIVGSIRGLIGDKEQISPSELEYAQGICKSYGSNTFVTNADHYAPDYERILRDGLGGVIARIEESQKTHQSDPDEHKLIFLQAAHIAMKAFSTMVCQYGDCAIRRAQEADECARSNLLEIGRICHKIASDKPDTFREALQLIWLCHVAFLCEGRYAMALGRLDQYLYPFYRADVEKGTLKPDDAVELLACTLYKIRERRYYGGDDVVNIAIAGRMRNGEGGCNPLSYLVIEAVKRCNIPGPNLSARLYEGIEDSFIDACLVSIGTGLGYPALMNDEVNIPALARWGYAIEDCRDYSMVGCIENFITGRQPPWSDGRYNSPKFMELALNQGRCMITGVGMGPVTPPAEEMRTMGDYMDALRVQMEYGAAQYMALFNNENDRYNRKRYVEPFLSCFAFPCIERAKDINDGGTQYPSVHGAGCMGIGTMADALAAIEQVVFDEEAVTLPQLRDALLCNFAGHEPLRRQLRKAPKYGNDLEHADKYAVWYVKEHDRIFSKYRTRDGGGIYIAIASNVSNIPAGKEVAATADGRLSGTPLSDAASPAHGADQNGPTAVLLSTAKPDYTKVSCGTVLNQKLSPSLFATEESRGKLREMIKVYFKMGGQEIQINSVSRKTLKDAMERPDEYANLVVRVSGFSAYYTRLRREEQLDILARTEHNG